MKVKLAARTAAVVSAAAVVLVTAGSVSAATPAAAHSAARPAPVSAATTRADKALVTYVYDQLFNHDNTSVIDRYVSQDYQQHNPTVANGPEALRQLVDGLFASNPNSHNTIERVTAQGDLTMIQSNAGASSTFKGVALVDVFRVSDGKIVEHWDTLQVVPADSANGHDMFSTLSGPTTGASSTAASERVVLDYVRRLDGAHDLSAVDRYVSPSLYQHDPAIADGAKATKQAYATLFAAHPQATATVAKVVAEGDLVTVHLHDRNAPDDLGTSVYEVFRVQHGKIVEHWSYTQAVPATSVSGNSMF